MATFHALTKYHAAPCGITAGRTLFQAAAFGNRRQPVHRRCTFRARGSSTDQADVGTAGTVAIATGLVSNPIVLWSAYTLKTTGSGLPPGPGGVLGAAEGISYLVVLGIIGWSIATKARTGSGLPAGPSGLLGAVEGLSYLSLLATIVVFGLTFLEKGSLPGPLG